MRYVYKIQNAINGKIYIGQSVNPTRRKAGHFCDAKRGNEYPLSKSIRKHGRENFSFEVIDECEDSLINEREIYWIAFYDSTNREKGYNQTKGGTQLPKKPRTTDHRQRQREATKRYWATSPDAEARRQQIIEKNKSEKGRASSKAVQDKRWSDASQREAMSVRLKGKPKSEDQKQKIAASHDRRWKDPELRAKMLETIKNRRSTKGIKRSPCLTLVICQNCQKQFKVITNTHKLICK